MDLIDEAKLQAVGDELIDRANKALSAIIYNGIAQLNNTEGRLITDLQTIINNVLVSLDNWTLDIKLPPFQGTITLHRPK